MILRLNENAEVHLDVWTLVRDMIIAWTFMQ